MQTEALGHPVHPMLIVFPLGLLATSLIFDLIHGITGHGRWSDIAFYLIGAGLIGGLVAASFGLVDWLSIPKHTRAKRIGAYHGLFNVGVVALFAASWGLRYAMPADPPVLAYVLAVLGGAGGLVSGWLGGELVDRLGVGVDDGAHVDAPSSLRRQEPVGIPIRRT